VNSSQRGAIILDFKTPQAKRTPNGKAAGGKSEKELIEGEVQAAMEAIKDISKQGYLLKSL
jgi:hypothetical protein